ncbi:hypothetical protein MY3296_004773 [Beauveria thailandica]
MRSGLDCLDGETQQYKYLLQVFTVVPNTWPHEPSRLINFGRLWQPGTLPRSPLLQIAPARRHCLALRPPSQLLTATTFAAPGESPRHAKEMCTMGHALPRRPSSPAHAMADELQIVNYRWFSSRVTMCKTGGLTYDKT